MRSSPSILLALALPATATTAAAALSATNRRTQNVAADPTLLTLDRIVDSSEFGERGLSEYQWSKHTASYFILDALQSSNKGRDSVRNVAATGHEEIVVPASAFVLEGESEVLNVESFEFSADESKLLLDTNSKRVTYERENDLHVQELRKMNLPRSGQYFPSWKPKRRDS